ncbi:CheR family methyltransferase [Conexibacter sp. SYSU D00693]|uniref:CheR family methyltransferase n=1 Tax=Conexibacter sp. SYSU D00693 TaxID=2812560 RepID=UPI00196B28D8|nr:CheR family methyltransferase [Conexibacter sp. SYSU D00693]
MSTSDSAPLDALLDYLKRSRGFDFSGYKRSSLERRISKRMAVHGCADYAEYLDFLEVHPDEFSQLFNTILINVTAFFRDPAAWDQLREDVLPKLLASRPAGMPIRVWCAGCASGEEAYTLAMVLAEALGEQEYRDRVKVYATDVDEEALAEARAATYTPKQVEGVPRELLDRYFERLDGRFCFRKDLRRSVIFGRNDLVQDAPISRIDLLLCRNTLMYFTAETQARILGRFHFALHDDGVLFLGKSEMLITHTELFKPVDLKHRIFTRVQRRGLRARTAFPQVNGSYNGENGIALRETAYDAGPSPSIVVDADGVLSAANQEAQVLFALGPPDLGRPLQDLEISYRPVELRTHLEKAYADRQGLLLQGVRLMGRDERERFFDVQITPLYAGEVLLGASVTFLDVSAQQHLRRELERAKVELENAYEELQSTVEELETTNEELQSTNEELETTNEELQSTNEELETMNEELSSTNEELETINDELRQRTLEVNETNAFLETILRSMGVGVLVLDDDQRVRMWNTQAEELWGLRSEEVAGQHVQNLDIGLPVEQLGGGIRSVLSGKEAAVEVVVDATNRRGRDIRCRVTVLGIGPEGRDPHGAIVLMAEVDGARPGGGAVDGAGGDGASASG